MVKIIFNYILIFKKNISLNRWWPGSSYLHGCGSGSDHGGGLLSPALQGTPGSGRMERSSREVSNHIKIGPLAHCVSTIRK